MSVTDLEQIWPPDRVRIGSGDPALRVIRDEHLPEPVDLVLDGIHDRDRMPPASPWIEAEPTELPADFERHRWRVRSRLSPERFGLPFAVLRNGDMVGVQGLSAQDFATTRTGRTGSVITVGGAAARRVSLALDDG